MKMQFLKLGGSLITNKAIARTARIDVLTRLAEEIFAAKNNNPGMRLVLGHGSGSFGHIPAKKYGTREGVNSKEEWFGFAEVWRNASALNHLVIEIMAEAGLPVIAFAPSASVTAENGRIVAWDLYPLRTALQEDLIPVVFGDVVFDRIRGGTILSTEDLFEYLAHELRPNRILLAGIEPGVWADYPACTRTLDEIMPGDLPTLGDALSGSADTDVTGGMASKVQLSLALVEGIPGLEIRIFSGEVVGELSSAISGEPVGTSIQSGNRGSKKSDLEP